MRSKKLRKKSIPYLMLLPTLALITVFMLYPMFRTIQLSFQNSTILTEANAIFIGLTNYENLMKDDVFIKSVQNTIPWTIINVLLQLVIGTLIALMLNQKFKGRGLMRALAFSPWAVGGMIVALIFKFLFNGSVGVIGDLLLKLGITDTRMAWYADAKPALATMIVANTWRGIPFFAVTILAALQGIPEEIYESSRVDGSNAFSRFFKITLPMIKDTVLLTTLLRTIWTLNIVDIIYSMTGGGPNNATITLPVYIMQKFTDTLDSSYCSAMAVMMVLALVIFAVLYLKISKYGKEGLY